MGKDSVKILRPGALNEEKFHVSEVVITYETNRSAIFSGDQKRVVQNIFQQEILASCSFFSKDISSAKILEHLGRVRRIIEKKIPKAPPIVFLECERKFPKEYSGIRKLSQSF